MSNPHPVVDVIIAVYNGARYLAEAIESVLAQTYTAVDLIVVDDGSADQSLEVAARYPTVRVFHQPHTGLGAALNLAIRQANSAMLAFLDADDLWLPDKLENQVRYLVEHPPADMVFGYARQFRQADPDSGTPRLVEGIQPGISRCGMLIWRASFARVGEFAENPDTHPFVDWYARACEAGLQRQVIPDVVFERRIHDDNMGRRQPIAQRQSYLKALRLSVARRSTGTPPAQP